MKSIIRKVVSVMLVLALTFSVELINSENVSAATSLNIYLTVGESYSKKVGYVKPIFYKYQSSDEKYITASWDSRDLTKREKFTIKAVAPGSCTFYVCRKNSTAEENQMIQVNVHVYASTSSNSLSLTNNVSITNGTKTNVSVYLYTTKSASLTANLAEKWPSSVAGESTGKAKAVSTKWASSNTSIATVNSSGKVTAVKQGSCTMTCTKSWVTSTGTTRTESKSIYVYVVTLPTLKIYEGQKEISSKTITDKSKLTLTYSLVNMGSYPIKSATCTSMDTNKFTVANSNGSFVITPKTLTNGTPVNAVFKLVHNSTVYQHNGESAATFTKSIPINIIKDTTVTVTSIMFKKDNITIVKGKNTVNKVVVSPENATNKEVDYSSDNPAVAKVDSSGKITAISPGTATITAISNADKSKKDFVVVRVIAPTTKLQKAVYNKNGVKLTWAKSPDAVKYSIYRAGSDGIYRKIGSSEGRTYTDGDVTVGKKYCYRISVVPEAGEGFSSSHSNTKKCKPKPLQPKIKSIKKSYGKYKIKISGVKYDGFIVYAAKNKKPKRAVGITKSTTATISLNKGKYYIRIRAYKTVDGKKIYSNYSKTKKVRVK